MDLRLSYEAYSRLGDLCPYLTSTVSILFLIYTDC
nr:MAG TPA: hypothetical protein [Caudoviricetes sp.]